MGKVLFVATVDVNILSFHLPYLKYFRDKGYEVHVTTNGNCVIPYCDRKFVIPFVRSPFRFDNLRAIGMLRRIIEREKYDIVHVHTPVGGVVGRIASIRARRWFKTRVIYTAHGFHFFKGSPILNWVLFYPIEKFLARFTDDLITINREDYSLASRKFKTRVHFIPGVGIDRSKFCFDLSDCDRSNFRKMLGFSDSDFIMIYVARLDKNKNHGFLINVMDGLRNSGYSNVHLICVGSDELDGYYKKIVDMKNLNQNIHFLGFRDDVNMLLKIADVSVSASLREGLPVNLIEAMASGNPVVAVDCRGTRDLIKNGINGFLFDKNDVDLFKSKIEDFCDGKVSLEKIGMNNIKDSKRYLLNNVIKKYKKIYECR
ncbi:MAG: glycosyltransferase family 4 protein [Bacilli bacterium]|nr:glycosyltransferase family 4 protein [Bacilli bacterium]